MTERTIDTVLEELVALSDEGKIDLYTALAAAEHSIEQSAVTPDQRTEAKRNFLKLAYGGKRDVSLDLDALMAVLQPKELPVIESPTGRLPQDPQDPMRSQESEGQPIPSLLEADYTATELRIMAESGLLPSGIQAARSSSLYPNAGGGARVIQPAGVVLETPMDKAMKKVRALGRDKWVLLARYKAMPDGNHSQRRRRDALGKRIRRFLPPGVTMNMALSLIG